MERRPERHGFGCCETASLQVEGLKLTQLIHPFATMAFLECALVEINGRSERCRVPEAISRVSFDLSHKGSDRLSKILQTMNLAFNARKRVERFVLVEAFKKLLH